jgi:hypothetical protein
LPIVTEAVMADALPRTYSCASSYGLTALSMRFCVQPDPAVNAFDARSAKNAIGNAALLLGAPEVTESVVPLVAEFDAYASITPLVFLISYSTVPKAQVMLVASGTAPVSPPLTLVKITWPR